MSDEIEAAATVTTGLIAASAVESGDQPLSDAGHTHCLNCGATLSGAFCAACGQSAHVHRSISGFIHDLLHSIFHFEGKVWRTLPMLGFRPGDLTRRYAHGERVRFVSPLALFLFSLFLMFAAFSWVGGPLREVASEVNVNLSLSEKELTEKIAAKEKELARLNATGTQGQSVGEGARDALEGELEGLKAAKAVRSEDGGTGTSLSVDTGNMALDKRIQHAIKNPELFLYKVQSSAYKYGWLLIPISVPFLWLLFAARRDIPLYDHLVFVTYSLSFMAWFLVLLALMGQIAALDQVRDVLMIVAPPLHMFAQLRRAYGLSVTGALWRTVGLLIAALVSLIIFFMILIVLGSAG